MSSPLLTPAEEHAVGPVVSLPDDQGIGVSTGVPAPMNAIIGREKEISAVDHLLRREDVRLVTLTGPGGVGKTRLALAMAECAGTFADGVVFVPLAPVQDASLVAAAIAGRLEIQESGSRPLVEALTARLRGERVLLILDNLEHLPGAFSLVTELLRACPGLTVLATSRRRLDLSGEYDISVPPLAVAAPQQPATLEHLAAVPAIQLFVARAQAATPTFALSQANGQLVLEICQRLDGLPLAIELAAPRTRVLSPAALLSRLTNRLRLLTDGPRDAPTRLQTMRQAIDWSYDLLDPAAQALLRRLAVFADGCSLDAAEFIGLGEEDGRASPPSSAADILELVTVLVDESLLFTSEQPDGERRFGMLETVREYALERLAEAGEVMEMRRRHAAYVLHLVEQADPWQSLPKPWLDRLQGEHGNLRVALAWSLEQDPVLALRLANGLWRFWLQQGYWSEGRSWLRQALSAALEAPQAVRVDALCGAGRIAVDQGDFGQATLDLDASLTLAQEIGDERRIARAQQVLGIVASNQSEFDRAEELFAAALARLRTLSDQAAVARCLNDLGLVANRRGNDEHAIAYYEQALLLARTSHDQAFAALLLGNLAGAYMSVGDWARGEALTEEALDQSRVIGDRFGIAINLYNLGDCVQRRGDLAGAWERYRESLVLTHELGEQHLASRILDRIAQVLTAAGLPREAAHLLGAAAAQRRRIGDTLFPSEEHDVAETIAIARTALNDETFQAAWETGAALTAEQAVASALASDLPPACAARHGPLQAALAIGLTTREMEVLGLVAAGRSDKEIAVTLAISRHTASKHVAAVRAKLHAPSRTGAVNAAREAGLL